MIPQYELIKLDINLLKFDNKNPNKLTTKQFEALKHSLTKYGYLEPVIIDTNNNIIDGHHRALALKQLGQSTITAYQIHLSKDSDRRLIRQAKNKIKGQHDKELDAEEYLALYEANSIDELTQLTAQSTQDVKDLLTEYYPKLEGSNNQEQTNQENSNKFDVKLGSIFTLNSTAFLMCADPTDKRSISRVMQQLDNTPSNIILLSTNYNDNNATELLHNISPNYIILSPKDVKINLPLDLTTLLYNPYPTTSTLTLYGNTTSYYIGIHPDIVVCNTLLAHHAQRTHTVPHSIVQ